MTVNPLPPPIGGDALLARIQQALGEAVREAILRHKREGNPVAVWRDGKVVWIEPRDIPVDID